MKETVPILINDLSGEARADEKDVLVQAEAVKRSLERLGLACVTIPFTADRTCLRRRLGGPEVKAVFNLVEAVEGENALQYLARPPLRHRAGPHALLRLQEERPMDCSQEERRPPTRGPRRLVRTGGA